VNDGEEMDRSLRELSSLGPRLLSIAGVPVGLTRFGQERQTKQMRLSRTCMRLLPHKQISVRRYRPEEAEQVIDQAEQWQERFRDERGTTFFHLGDEFYLMTGREVPPADIYDGYPQIEDGIGITRHFLENLAGYLRRTQSGALAGARGTVACATLIGPTIRDAVARFNAHTGAELKTVVVENRFFGPEINVSGLLTGQDLIGALRDDDTGGPVYVSDRMISDRTHTMMDDMSVDQVSAALSRPLVPCSVLSEVGRDLRTRQRDQRAA
ncbi:MAG TPA: DUF512 domain-containing protein, partial [Thermomicrobiales bacterium]|nr:DUF512 domain-containing protein [Thermomicrobiales bacterium]